VVTDASATAQEFAGTAGLLAETMRTVADAAERTKPRGVVTRSVGLERPDLSLLSHRAPKDPL
jgi:hypothetical protein